MLNHAHYLIEITNKSPFFHHWMEILIIRFNIFECILVYRVLYIILKFVFYSYCYHILLFESNSIELSWCLSYFRGTQFSLLNNILVLNLKTVDFLLHSKVLFKYLRIRWNKFWTQYSILLYRDSQGVIFVYPLSLKFVKILLVLEKW